MGGPTTAARVDSGRRHWLRHPLRISDLPYLMRDPPLHLPRAVIGPAGGAGVLAVGCARKEKEAWV